MRSFIGVMVLVLAVVMAGCSSGKKSDSHEAGQKACVMKSGGHDVLTIMVPTEAPCMAGDGSVMVNSREGYVEVWMVRGAHSLDDGVKKVDQVIVSEFKGFKATKTSEPDFGGAPAKRLVGSGNEADDNDPGMADVIVFMRGGNVFVACTHGESLRASAQKLMVEIVKSAKAP